MTRVNRDTYISLSMVIALIGGIVWLTNVYATAKQNSEDIKEIKVDLKDDKKRDSAHRNEHMKILFEIRDRISNIEGKLGR